MADKSKSGFQYYLSQNLESKELVKPYLNVAERWIDSNNLWIMSRNDQIEKIVK